MKRRVLELLLFLLIVPFIMGCDQNTTEAVTTTAENLETTTSPEILGTVTIEIITQGDDPNTIEVETEYVSYTVDIDYTEADTLFGLLTANFTLTYESSDYGRYLTSIGTLIPETGTHEYISFYIDDSYSLTGVDDTELVDGQTYQFKIETW